MVKILFSEILKFVSTGIQSSCIPLRLFLLLLLTGSVQAQTTGYSTILPVFINYCFPSPPDGPANQYFCDFDNPTVADLSATGSNIKWYNVESDGTPLEESTLLITADYYASQTVEGYESTTRLAVSVTVSDPDVPYGSANQSFCAIDNPMVASLVVMGDNVQWYDLPEGGTPLAITTSLIQGTYFASQTINGCESIIRFAVSATILNPEAPTGPVNMIFCSDDNPVVSDLLATGSNIKWYDVPSGGSVLEGNTVLTSGTYYASQTIDGCESVDEMALSVEIGATPVTSSIAGNENPQCFETGVTYDVILNSGSSYAWTVPQEAVITSGGTGPENNSILVNFGSQSGIIEVTETSALGCTGSAVQLSVTLPECGPLADFSASDTEICQEENTMFTDLSLGTTGSTVYEWDFGENAVPATANTSGPHTVHYTTPGLKTVQLTVTDISLNTLIQSDYISVYPDPVVGLGNDTTVCGGNTILLDAGAFSSYNWSTGETSRSVIAYEGAGLISVTVTDENGCQASDAILILDCDPVELLGPIPNIFTPNNDQIHDSWVINNIYLFPDVTILVYDRWGRLVFEVDGGYKNDWYGTDQDGNDLPVGTYYYILDLHVSGSEPFKGTVSILR